MCHTRSGEANSFGQYRIIYRNKTRLARFFSFESSNIGFGSYKASVINTFRCCGHYQNEREVLQRYSGVTVIQLSLGPGTPIVEEDQGVQMANDHDPRRF